MLPEKLIKDLQAILSLNIEIVKYWNDFKNEKGFTHEERLDTLMMLLLKQVTDFQNDLIEALK